MKIFHKVIISLKLKETIKMKIFIIIITIITIIINNKNKKILIKSY